MQQRRDIGSFVLAIPFIAIACAPAMPQDYPSRPIRLIVSSPADSLVDVLSRLLTQDLSARLGQSIIVDTAPQAPRAKARARA